MGTTSPVQVEMATMDEARTVASNWLALIVQHRGDWAGSTSPEVMEIREFTRGERFLGYFCSVKPKGYMVISPLKELPPLHAYSELSDLDPDSDEGMADLIKVRMERVLNGIEGLIGPIESAGREELANILETNYRGSWEELGRAPAVFRQQLSSGAVLTNYAESKVLLSSLWDQVWPYNSQCPRPDPPCTDPALSGHTLAGCGPVAAGQVMRHWNWPPYGEDGSPYTDPYDWPNMPDILGWGSPAVQIDAVAELLYEVGLAADASYGCTGTLTSFEAIETALHIPFRYHLPHVKARQNYSAEDWFYWIKAEIDSNRPLPYKIPGHNVVVDGWREVGAQNEYHVNYGWGEGANTAWFVVDLIPGGNPPDEFMLAAVWPEPAAGAALSGTYSKDPSFPYRYFDLDATSTSATFNPGQNLQLLPGIEVTGTGGTGQFIRFEGSASDNTRLFTMGDTARGIRIRDAALKLTNNGSISLVPLGAPRYLDARALTSVNINVSWEAGHGDQWGFEIERAISPGWTYNYLATTPATSYTDSYLSPGTMYCYRVRAVKGGVYSDYPVGRCATTPPS
jgi:hypothetical protein